MGDNIFLPGTGRGTIRRMGEGDQMVTPTYRSLAIALAPLHPDAARRGPPPRAGEELF